MLDGKTKGRCRFAKAISSNLNIVKNIPEEIFYRHMNNIVKLLFVVTALDVYLNSPFAVSLCLCQIYFGILHRFLFFLCKAKYK